MASVQRDLGLATLGPCGHQDLSLPKFRSPRATLPCEQVFFRTRHAASDRLDAEPRGGDLVF